MNLTIDAGNSRVKWAIFDDDNLIYKNITDLFEVEYLDSLCDQYSVHAIIIANSRNLHYDSFNKSHIKQLMILDHNTPLPIVNGYETPSTLGRDRLAGAVGAYMTFPNHNILFFDCGTAMTINYITAESIFKGGNIVPGLNMRLKALHHFTDKLPLITLNDEVTETLLGKNTTEAIYLGAIHGICAEIEYYFQKVNSINGNTKVILTGGNASMISHYLTISYVIKPDLTLEGLNQILKYNV